MSVIRSAARAYARAVFDLSIENNNIDQWESSLVLFSTISTNDVMKMLFLKTLDIKKLSDIFIVVCEDYKKKNWNLLNEILLI